jgi:hypothetical protein
MKSAALFFATGGAMIFYFQYEKARLERKRIVEMSKGYGKPKVGGPFKLRDLDGKEFTEKDLLGKYSLVRTLCAEATTPLTLPLKSQARTVCRELTMHSDLFRFLTLP